MPHDEDRVRGWPWVSLNMRPHHLAAWTALARSAGRSRADLMREALEQVGLPYARSVARAAGGGLGGGTDSVPPRDGSRRRGAKATTKPREDDAAE